MILSAPLLCQTKSSGEKTKNNLEVFYSLVDSAANNSVSNIPNVRDVKLNFDFGNSYSVFGNQIIKVFNDNRKRIITDTLNNGTASAINFVIDHALVRYDKPFRKSLFGDYYTKREITLGGNYAVMQPKVIVKNFAYSYIDTVEANKVKEIENASFPFTKGQLPAEPFLSSVYEPVIAIGAAALTVILFFTVRSK